MYVYLYDLQRKQSTKVLNSSKCRQDFRVKKIQPTHHVQVAEVLLKYVLNLIYRKILI